MCCLITTLAFLGPRLTIVVWYLINPSRWNEVFNNSFIVQCLGFLLLPWTTLMYVLVSPDGGVTGFKWALLILAFLIDISAYGGGGYGNRKRFRRVRTS